MKVYLYCTKAKPYYTLSNQRLINIAFPRSLKRESLVYDNIANGQVIAEFSLDYISEISVFNDGLYVNVFDRISQLRDIKKEMCLTQEELEEYVGINKKAYSWWIEDLNKFNKPMDLSEFRIKCDGEGHKCDKCKYSIYKCGDVIDSEECMCNNFKPLLRAPQSWCYVIDPSGMTAIMLSLQSKWCDKIFTGEKTLEVRKTCPKEFKK